MVGDATSVLDTLKDVPGVLGSFVCNVEGELLHRAMPAYFDGEALGEVGPRAARIFESLASEPDVAECVLRFEEHRLYLRVIEQGLLCMLATPDAPTPAMRTAAGMVARRLAALSSSPGSPSAAMAASAPTTTSALPTPPSAAAPAGRTSGPPSDATPAGRGSMPPADPVGGASEPHADPAGRESMPAANQEAGPVGARPPRAAAPGGPRRRVRVYRGQRFES